MKLKKENCRITVVVKFNSIHLFFLVLIAMYFLRKRDKIQGPKSVCGKCILFPGNEA